ncbi:MAG: helix-turn-helix domain-containing protein [Planctomycetota bacterium]
MPACRQSDIEAGQCPQASRIVLCGEGARAPVDMGGAGRSLAELEKEHIQSVYHECRYNKKRTARILRVSLNCLKGKFKKYHIPDPSNIDG